MARAGTQLWWLQMRSVLNKLMQVFPIRIEFFDKLNFPIPFPRLQLALAFDGGRHVWVMLIPDEQFQSILGREPLENIVLVFGNTVPQRTRHANVYRPAIAIGHHVDSRLLLFPHVPSMTSTKAGFQRSPSLLLAQQLGLAGMTAIFLLTAR